MVKAKDFKNVDYAFILKNAYTGSSREPEIIKVEIEKVGRKYVTAGSYQFKQSTNCEFGLFTSGFGRAEYLCLSEEDAGKILEKKELQRWFHNVNVYSNGKYTLEQLKKVKEILGD